MIKRIIRDFRIRYRDYKVQREREKEYMKNLNFIQRYKCRKKIDELAINKLKAMVDEMLKEEHSL